MPRVIKKMRNQKEKIFSHAAFVARKRIDKISLYITNFVCGKSVVISPTSARTFSPNAPEIKTLTTVLYHVIKIFIVVDPKIDLWVGIK